HDTGPGSDRAHLASSAISHTGSSPALDLHTEHLCLGENVQRRRLAPQVARGGRTAQACALRKLDVVDPLGKLAVEVGGARDAGLLGRSDPLVGNRVARADLGNVDRSALPAPGVATALVVLEPAEI